MRSLLHSSPLWWVCKTRCFNCLPVFASECGCVWFELLTLRPNFFVVVVIVENDPWRPHVLRLTHMHTNSGAHTLAQTNKTAVRVGRVISPACFSFKGSCIAVQPSIHIWEWVCVPCGSVLSVHSALGLICIPLCMNKGHLFWGQSLPAAI